MTAAVPERWQPGYLFGVAAQPDGPLLGAACSDGRLRLWAREGGDSALSPLCTLPWNQVRLLEPQARLACWCRAWAAHSRWACRVGRLGNSATASPSAAAHHTSLPHPLRAPLLQAMGADCAFGANGLFCAVSQDGSVIMMARKRDDKGWWLCFIAEGGGHGMPMLHAAEEGRYLQQASGGQSSRLVQARFEAQAAR